MENYGEILKFGKKQIDFPDFAIKFLRKRTGISNPDGGRTFKCKYFDFEVKANSESKPLVWSLETSDIQPVEFEINNKKFALEMIFSKKLDAFLEDNQMVVSLMDKN